MKEYWVALALLENPFDHHRAIAPPGTRQMEDKLGSLIKPMLPAYRLNVVAIERTSPKAVIQLAEQVLLPQRI